MSEKVYNDIKVLYERYNDKIKIDNIDGSVVLYNQSNIKSSRLGLFTGIKFIIDEKVTLDIQDFNDNKIKYYVEKGYVVLDIKDLKDYQNPICTVKFVPKNNTFGIKKFYEHLIEINNRG